MPQAKRAPALVKDVSSHCLIHLACQGYNLLLANSPGQLLPVLAQHLTILLSAEVHDLLVRAAHELWQTPQLADVRRCCLQIQQGGSQLRPVHCELLLQAPQSW